jgi:hypothetical protein|tara:strand:- start:424 stop:654 length:231 start_codon:yes stop_codon:yes gene_type:complete
MTILKNSTSSVRIWATNPDHHLYNNNGTWWLHYTSYPTPETSKRIRRSLRTHIVKEAREQRDAIFAKIFFNSKEVE